MGFFDMVVKSIRDKGKKSLSDESEQNIVTDSPEYEVVDDNHISIKISDNPNRISQIVRILGARKEYEKKFGRKFPQTVFG